MRSTCYFLSSGGKKIKNITKIEQKRQKQKLIYIINIWFNFVSGSFFEQGYLLKLVILGAYAKRWPKCASILKQELVTPKSQIN